MQRVRFLVSAQLLFFILLLLAGYPQSAYTADHEVVIREWKIAWVKEYADATNSTAPTGANWVDSDSDNPTTSIPDGFIGMWVRIHVPPTADWKQPALLIHRLYGYEIAVYKGNDLLFETKRSLVNDITKLVMPIERLASSADYYIRIIPDRERAGLLSSPLIGNFDQLNNPYIADELPDLMIGTSIAFLGLIMLVCSGFLSRTQRRYWVSLSLIALSIGTLIILYSPLPYILVNGYTSVFAILFDLSMFTLFPTLHYYIDLVFERRFALFTKFGRIVTGYAVLCFVALLFNEGTDRQYHEYYSLLSGTIWGAFILALLIFIVLLSIRNARKGNRDSLLLSLAFLALALSGAADLIMYYISGKEYILFLWKFGVLILIATLVIILAKRIMADHHKLITYSKELELYNHKLLHSEKMKIISDLAASVAHEIRNPLQVTRGFLQLVSERSDDKNKYYMDMAISELDRAASIITDFLTFAKPEMDTMTVLDLGEEIRRIEAIMTPLASIQGGVLRIRIEEKLLISGNSSKFKQAFINFIKNSIEALQSNGIIEIEAYAKADQVFIHIRDNGEGMEESELSKLGVPFFSTKTKGTGLGLMVSLRIIAAMEGKTDFHSTKGKGTEITVRFPRIAQDTVLPDNIRA